MTITKNSLVNLLHAEVGLNKREAKELIETFFESIKSELENGNDVKISGFGNFNLRDKGARPGRNPKTGEDVIIILFYHLDVLSSQLIYPSIQN